MTSPLDKRDFVTVVSGVPRSGTSLMMQTLAAGGFPVLTDRDRPADASNPQGYLEFSPVSRLRSDKSWLGQAAGKAVKVVHALLRELPVDGPLNFRVLFMRRPLPEVVASQRAMLERQGKNAGDDNRILGVYEQQLREIGSWLAAHPRIRWVDLEYHLVLEQPLDVATQVAAFLETDLDISAMVGVVRPELCHHRAGEDSKR